MLGGCWGRGKGRQSHDQHVYRVNFRVLEKERYVDGLHIRHGAMDELEGERALPWGGGLRCIG